MGSHKRRGRVRRPVSIRPALYNGLRFLFYLLPMPASARSRLRSWLLAHFRPLLEALLRRPPVSWPELDSAFRLDVPTPRTVDSGTLAFPERASPLASIIVPVFNKAEYTLTCLKSVQDECGDQPIELIVVDDHSQDATESLVGRIPGIRYLRNDKNLGFTKSCNRGAAAAKGKYLVFLNNDTVVQQGWLKELIRTMEEVPGTGLVGSQLINADGTLQEAGGLIWSDGSGWNYGRGRDRRSPEFNYLRDTSYCSGASILVEKELFDELGGFDERFAPAYYEDTDLAFKVRDAGRRVLYQPWSRALHFEGVSCGTDLSSGVKQYQVRNQALFREKWADVLKRLPAGPAAGARPVREGRCRVLIIDACTPTPDRDSGSVDAFVLMKMLKEMCCDVTFMPDNMQFLDGYTPALQRIGVECLYQPFVGNNLDYIRQNGRHFDLVLLTRFYIADRYIDAVRKYCEYAKVGFIVVDLHYLRELRKAETHDSRKLRNAAEQTKWLEQAVIRKSDLTIVKSDIEQQLIADDLGDCPTFLLPLIIDNGDRRDTPYEDRRNFIFVGGFQHPPNIDAVHYMVSAIWPSVRLRLPDTRLLIVGGDMPEDIRTIAADGVEIVGQVSDLGPLLNRSRVMVAPLRYGAGVKGKVGRSLGYGLPCVATSMAVEGMALRDGLDVLVADGDGYFADRCVELYTDAELWRRLAENGLAFFERELSLRSGRAKVRAMLQELGCGGLSDGLLFTR